MTSLPTALTCGGEDSRCLDRDERVSDESSLGLACVRAQKSVTHINRVRSVLLFVVIIINLFIILKI
jgi:hypothetical protein